MPPEDLNTGVVEHDREPLETDELLVGEQAIGEPCSAPDDRHSCEREGRSDR